jgi:hypothetical protein
MIYIYGLVDPETREICYVGKTHNVRKRLRDHIERSKVVAVSEWIENLEMRGFSPLVVILEKVEDVDKVKICEQWWISHGLRLEWPLINKVTTFSIVSTNDVKRQENSSTDAAFGFDDEMAETIRELYIDKGYSKNAIIRELWPNKNKATCLQYIDAALSRQEVSA